MGKVNSLPLLEKKMQTGCSVDLDSYPERLDRETARVHEKRDQLNHVHLSNLHHQESSVMPFHQETHRKQIGA